MKIFGTKIKAAFLAFAASFAIYFAVALVGGYISLHVKLVVGCITFFFAVLFALKNQHLPNKNFAFLLVAGFPLFAFVWFNVFQFREIWVSFWSSLFICLGAVSGYFYYKKQTIIIPLITALLIPLWFLFVKKPFENKMVYGSYDQTVLFKYPDVKIFDTTNTEQNFYNPYIYYLIDFSSSSCGACYRQFPFVDSVAKIADSTKFKIISLNIPIWEEKKEDNFNLLDSFGYSFQKLFAPTFSVADSFGVKYFPTTIVVKSNHIIFRGDFEEAVKRFKVAKL